MDDNESALNQHMREIEASDKAQDWKDNYIEELLDETGEYYPFKPDNFQEAIAELDYAKLILLTSYSHVAAKIPSNSSNTNFAEYTVKIVRQYWRNAAVIKADRDYDEYCRGL